MATEFENLSPEFRTTIEFLAADCLHNQQEVLTLRQQLAAAEEAVRRRDLELEAEMKKVRDLEKPAAFGWQCYQDRCENAYVEASVVKRLREELAEAEAREAVLRTFVERQHRGFLNILEFRKMADSDRYGALTREEVEDVISQAAELLVTPSPKADALLRVVEAAEAFGKYIGTRIEIFGEKSAQSFPDLSVCSYPKTAELRKEDWIALRSALAALREGR